MTAAKRILLNGTATVLQKFVLVGQQLLLVPFFLKAWGAEYYGEWLVLSAIPSALALSDLGLASAVANAFVLRYAGGDTQGGARVMKTGTAIIAATTCAMATLALAGLALAWHFNWLGGLVIPAQVAIPALAFLALSRLISFYLGLGEAFFRAARRTHTFLHLGTGFGIVRILTGILVLWTGGNALHYALADCVVSIAAVATIQFTGRRLLPPLPAARVSRDSTELKELFSKSLAYLLIPLQQVASLQGTLLIIRAILGAEAVAVFNTLRTLCNAIHQVLSTINTSIFPEIQLAIAEGRLATARKIYCYGTVSAVGLACAGAIVLGFAGPSIYQVWTRGTLEPSGALWAMMLAALVFRSLWWTASMTFRAANRPHGIALYGLAAALAGLLASWLAAGPYGLAGVAAGALLAEMLISTYALPASSRLIRRQ